MALGAVGAVPREANLIEIEYPAGSVNRKVTCQFFAAMNSVNHEFEVNGLRRYFKRTAKRGRDQLRNIHVRRIMT